MQLATSLRKLDASDYPIKSVTIFQSARAEVVRVFPIELQAGENVLDIVNLPSCIDTDSVRVQGLGSAFLSDVICTPPPSRTGLFGTTYGSKPGKSEVLQDLESQRALLNGEQNVRAMQADFLVNYAKTLNGDNASPDDISTFLQSFNQAGKENVQVSCELARKIQELDIAIKEETENPTKPPETTHLKGFKVKVVIIADTDTPAQLSVTYAVANVRWSPLFDLRVTTEDGKPSKSMSLHYRASIFQNTGEDWVDANLTLSTASPHFMRTIPALSLVKIKPSTSQPVPVAAFGPTPAASQQSKGFAFGGSQPPQPFGSTGAGFGAFGAPQPAGGAFGAFGATQPTTGGLFGATASNTGSEVSIDGVIYKVPPSFSYGPAPLEWFIERVRQNKQAFASQQAQSKQAFGPPTGSLFGNTSNLAQNNPFSAIAPPPSQPPSAIPEMPPAAPFSQSSATVTDSGISATFQVKGKASIPSDNLSHSVAISAISLEAEIEHVAVPSVAAIAYLQCTVKNTSEYYLLRGPVNIYLDDGYVSKSMISGVAPQDTFTCSLGPDPSIRIAFSATAKRQESTGSVFSAQSDRITYTNRVNVLNKRQTSVSKIIIREVLPTSEDSAVKVVLRSPEGLAEAKENEKVTVKDGVTAKWSDLIDGKGGLQEGKMEWIVSLESREEKELDLVWDVTSPGGTRWQYSI